MDGEDNLANKDSDNDNNSMKEISCSNEENSRKK